MSSQKSGYSSINDEDRDTSSCCPKRRWSSVRKGVVIGSIGLVLSLVFVGAYFGVNAFVQWQLNKEDVLTKGSALEEEWASPTTPVYTNFYFFDLQNAEDVSKGAKPRFVERGPYAYREYKEKVNVSWSKDESIVSYLEKDYFVSDANRSSGDVTKDQVTTINVIKMILLVILSKESKWKQEILNEAIKLIPKESFFTTQSVYDFLWGRTDSNLKFLHRFDKNIPTKFAFQTNVTNPDPRNSSSVRTGVVNRKDIGEYVTYEGMSKLPFWDGDEANEIKGTEGYFFGPNISPNRPVYVFVDQLFRTGYFNFTSYQDLNGIELYRYSIPNFELASAKRNPANRVFYSFGPDGIANLTTVVPLNAPVYVSKPHFLDSDIGLLHNVTGLVPNREKHDSYMDIEPLSGAMLRAAKRLQMNVKIDQDEHLSDLKNIRSMYFPLFWAEEIAVASHNTTDELKAKLFTPLKIAYGVVFSALAVSGFMCIAGYSTAIVYFVKKRNKANKMKERLVVVNALHDET